MAMREHVVVDADIAGVPLPYRKRVASETSLATIINDAKRQKYVGMSLEEIAYKFGQEAAHYVYTMGTIGIDLTKPVTLKPTFDIVETCTFMLEADEGEWRVYLLNSPFWPDHLPQEIGHGGYSLSIEGTDFMKIALRSHAEGSIRKYIERQNGRKPT